MEKFFIVTEQSELHRDYFDWKNNLEEIRLLICEFFDRNDIETTQYGFHGDNLCIVPTENDLVKFNNVLSNEVMEQLRPFKGNSKIQKAWVKTLEENNLERKRKPYVPMYFPLHGGGRISSRLFDIDDIVYCSFSNSWDIKTPEGMIEIKASKFWETVEDAEEKRKVVVS